jgi:two-component system, OmpR family, manganese sensing sensor histidine kinase
LPTLAIDSGFGTVELERRLLRSYLAVFTAALCIAAAAVHFAFVNSLDRQMTARLEDVARAGLRSVLFAKDGIRIDKNEISNGSLLTQNQGLQWFDRRGRLLAEQGLISNRKDFRSETIPILNPHTGKLVGSIRASEWNGQEQAYVDSLDIGLLVGTLLALVASGAGGLVLARRAVRPVEQSFTTLRDFTADASHELRSPLAVITTTAEAALRDSSRDPEHDRLRFENIADGARQMSRLTADLLLLAGAERSLERDLFVVDLVAMLGLVIERYRSRFSAAEIALELSAQDPATAYGNPDQIERIVTNLLENALRYTPAGGSVTLEIRKEAAQTLVAVSDTGIGIAPEHLERIFDRFWRADPVRSSEGSGLGLAIARALARRHGGDVTATSRHGAGSTFVVSFPARPPSSRL